MKILPYDFVINDWYDDTEKYLLTGNFVVFVWIIINSDIWVYQEIFQRFRRTVKGEKVNWRVWKKWRDRKKCSLWGFQIFLFCKEKWRNFWDIRTELERYIFLVGKNLLKNLDFRPYWKCMICFSGILLFEFSDSIIQTILIHMNASKSYKKEKESLRQKMSGRLNYPTITAWLIF